MNNKNVSNQNHNKVDINPEILKWALEYCGRKNAIQKKFPKLDRWLEAEDMPTINQLRDLAKMTYVPLGYFFLEKPPKMGIDIPYFRTQENQPVNSFSAELIDTIHLMKSRQDWLREYFIEEGYEKLPFVKSFAKDSNPKVIAEDIKEVLKLQEFWAAKLSTWIEALIFLKDKIEAARIVVSINSVVGNNTQRKLEPKEFRGFVLVDEYAPLIFINGADSKAAQMFTIAHELAHIWIGSSAVFDLRELQPADDEIEKLCNRVAAEFLVPEEEFKKVYKTALNSDEPYQMLARHFKVSELVVARRTLDLGYITKNDYKAFYENYLKKENTSKKNKGGDFYLIQNMRLGRVFSEAVVRAVKEGKLLYRDAYRLTGLNGNTFEEFTQKILSGGKA